MPLICGCGKDTPPANPECAECVRASLLGKELTTSEEIVKAIKATGGSGQFYFSGTFGPGGAQGRLIDGNQGAMK